VAPTAACLLVGGGIGVFLEPARSFVFPHHASVPGRFKASRRSAGNRDSVLKAGNVQVWFPEGWRSPDGRLQRFLPGIGELLMRSGVPVVPTYIAGAFEALPRGRHIPKLHRITVTFGHPEPVGSLRATGTGRTDEERVANALRQSLIALGAEAGGTAGLAATADHPADSVVTRQ
jgi:Acyltransferase